MKKHINIIIFAVLIIKSNSVSAQFGSTGAGLWNTSGANVDKITIGTTTSYPSALYIDGGNLTSNNTGNVLETNGPASTATTWKMNQNGTEYFRIQNASSSANVSLGTISTGRFDIFTNGTANPRVSVLGSGNTGYVGIATTSPSSVLHIDGNGTPSPTGEVFRTNAPAGNEYWRMYMGGTEKFRIEIPTAAQNSVNLRGVTNGAMRLFTYDIQRIHVDNGNGVTSGYVGIGNSFTSPASRLHIYQNTTGGTVADNDVWAQWTSYATGANATDGLRVGIVNSSKNVELRQQENADMLFYTNSNEQARITAAGNVGIGLSAPAAKVDAILTGVASSLNVVYGATLNNSSSASNNVGNFTQVNTSGSNCNDYGVNVGCYATGSNTMSTGGSFAASGFATTYGIHCSASAGSYDNYGLHSIAQYASHDVIGVYSKAGSSPTSSNDVQGVHCEGIDGGGTFNSIYGIYAEGPSSCSVSAGGVLTCPKAAGYFNGDVGILGALHQTSDLNLKDSLVPIVNASTVLSQLSPKAFQFKTQAYPSMHLSPGTHYGLIAQEVLNVLPDIVMGLREPELKDSLGNQIAPSIDFLTLNYTEIIPFLIQGFKEQQVTIDSLRGAINGQMKQSNPNQQFIHNQNKISVELASDNSIILDQNDPNPFSDQTTIHYFIPENVGSAKIMFYDSNGNVLRVVDIHQKGDGSLTVYASQLKKGIYQYTLIADGKSIETKRMVKQ